MAPAINESCRALIQSAFFASNNGISHFGQVIDQLLSAGVEACQVDYRSGRATYYLPSGAALDLGFARRMHGFDAATGLDICILTDLDMLRMCGDLQRKPDFNREKQRKNPPDLSIQGWTVVGGLASLV